MTGQARRLCCTCLEQYAPPGAYKCLDCDVVAGVTAGKTARRRNDLRAMAAELGVTVEQLTEYKDFLPGAQSCVPDQGAYNPETPSEATKIQIERTHQCPH